jgi:NAD-dependent dihydropyrimidine dehydrogenase PreA subunit
MPRIINPELCVACGSCADVCPVSAISAGDAAYSINADECIDCGACEGTCPNEAITEA